MKIHSILLLILPAILIAGLIFSGMITWDDGGYSARGEEVEELLEEMLEEECFCGSTHAAQWVSLLVERVREAEQCSADALDCLPEDGSTFGLSSWMVPLRI